MSKRVDDFDPYVGMKQIVSAWSLIGIPLIIGAAVGTLYRLEFQLRLYYYYLISSIGCAILAAVHTLFRGGICETLMPRDVRGMGQVFVCGTVDIVLFIWIIVASLLLLYCAFIVWSDAQMCKEGTPVLSKRPSDLLSGPRSPTFLSSIGGSYGAVGAPQSSIPF